MGLQNLIRKACDTEGTPTDSQSGKDVATTPMRQLTTTDTVRLIGTTFGSGSIVDPNYWTIFTGSNATITASGGQVTLRTNTTAGATGSLQSVRTARYIGGSSNKYRAIVRLQDTGTSAPDTLRRWGCYQDLSGMFFQLTGSTFGVGARKGGTDTTVANGAFNGSYGPSITVDANVHTYEIVSTNTSAWFYYDDKLLHKLTGATTTYTDSLSLKIASEIRNTNSSIVDVGFDIRVNTISRLGHESSRPQWNRISTLSTNVLKYSAGTLHRIVMNKKGASNNYLSVIDGTASGSTGIIALIDATAVLNEYDYNLDFYTGLTVVNATGTPADVTVVYE